MLPRGLPAALAGLLPWIAAALAPGFTPAHALLAAVALRHGPPRRPPPREIVHDFLALAALTWVLHALRPDASPWVSAAILLAGLLLEMLRARPPGARAARIFLALALAGPASLTFFCRLAELPAPAALEAANPWRLAAAPAPSSARYEAGGQVWHAPPRAEPWPLSAAADAGARHRAWLLAGAAGAAALALTWTRRPLALLALLAAGAGPLLLRTAPHVLLLDGTAAVAPLVVEVAADFRPAADRAWDPERDAAPPGLRARRAGPGEFPESAEVAWLERHPLRTARQEGPAGALRLLAWYADADRPVGAVRWSLRADGVLVRRLLAP